MVAAGLPVLVVLAALVHAMPDLAAGVVVAIALSGLKARECIQLEHLFASISHV
jgi:hypothetical protein